MAARHTADRHASKERDDRRIHAGNDTSTPLDAGTAAGHLRLDLASSTPLEKVLAALHEQGRDVRRTSNGWDAQCPAHDDREPSLGVAVAGDGKVLLICRSNHCETKDVVEALGLTMPDLFPTARSKRTVRHISEALARPHKANADTEEAANIVAALTTHAEKTGADPHLIEDADRVIIYLENSRPIDRVLTTSPQVIPGGALLDLDPAVDALWGAGDKVLWARGEPLMIAAPQGQGKTTVMDQLILKRIGVLPGDFLGLPVKRTEGKVLLVAADRPRQIIRSLRRMISPEDRDDLDARLVIWQGPPPFNLSTRPDDLLPWIEGFSVSEVYIDALSSVATGLASDDEGGNLNRAFQEVIASGIDLVINHHTRKAQEGNRKPKSLDDVYGSTFLTSGCGSVVFLWSTASGSTEVELIHLKQPADIVGPLTLLHDHRAGVTTIFESMAPLHIAGVDREVAAKDVACELFKTEHPTAAQVEKARRRLEQMVAEGTAVKQGIRGSRGGHQEQGYVVKGHV